MDSFLTMAELGGLGLRSLGINVKISKYATFYRPELISLGDHVRIDDFCVITGSVYLGNFCHLAAHSVFSGAIESSIIVDDFCTFAYGVKIFSRSDDYHGFSMTGSVVPRELTSPISYDVRIGAHSIVGASSILSPGAILGEGTAVGAMSLIKSTTEPWTIYAGIPAKALKSRSKQPLILKAAISAINE